MMIYLETEAGTQTGVAYEAIARMVAEKVLDTEEFPYEAEVNLVITDDEEIWRVNREFRGIDRPTDVLSFPMIPFEQPADYAILEEDSCSYVNPDTEAIALGDIMISADKIIQQAEEYGHSREREFGFLVAHSMLHLLGYDHMEPQEAAVMEKKQSQVLEELGLGRDQVFPTKEKPLV